MVLLRGLESPQHYRGGYASIGNFDGVHRGHQQIVRRLAERANRDGVPAVVLTFEPHPLQLLRPEHVPQRLTTLEQKADLLAKAGATCVLAYPTDRKLLQLTPDQFFDAILISELNAKGIVEGPNFCFGKDRKGDIDTLRDLCQSRGVELDVVSPIEEGEVMVSSSAIRALVAGGRMNEAVRLLGHPFRVCGRVIEGARRGRTIGFPTANLEGIETLLPGDGVYAGRLLIDGRFYAAAINIGPNPTFHETARKLEVHVIDFSGDLYGRLLEVDLVARLRDTRPFDGKEGLIRQLSEDVKAARDSMSFPSDLPSPESAGSPSSPIME
jgi:riboflavin kinase/FMN adenylyltransferase